MTTDTSHRVRAGLQRYAASLPVGERPPLADVLQRPVRGATSTPYPAAGPSPQPARPARRRSGVAVPVLAAAAAVVVVAVGVTLASGGGDPVPVVPAVRAAWPAPSPVVWPLAGDVPAGAQGSAGAVAQAYVDMLELDADWRPYDRAEAVETGGDGSTVEQQFRVEGREGQLFVEAGQRDGRWFVTGVRSYGGPVIADAQADGEHVGVEVVPGVDAIGTPAGPLEVAVVGANGTTHTRRSIDQHDGAWRAEIPVGAAEARVVEVRLPVELPDGATMTMVAASVVVPPEALGDPVAAAFPASVGPVSYFDAWVHTLTRPDGPRTDWRVALARDVATIGSGAPLDPTFHDVVEDPGGRRVAGRVVTADGGDAAFEMARVRDGGPWFLLRLVDTAYDVRDVRTTDEGVEVTFRLPEAYTLAVGCGCRAPDGRRLDEVFGKAGEDVVLVRPFEPAGARRRAATVAVAMQATADGRLLRFFDAFAR